MQTSRLYRRIYKYITISVTLAVILTFGVTQLSFYLSNRERRENFAERVIEHQAGIVLFLLQELHKTQPPEVLASRTAQLAEDLHWKMRYIPAPVPESLQAQIEDRPLTLLKKGSDTLVLGSLTPREPGKGVIEFQIPEPRLDGKKGDFPFFKGPPRGPGGPPPPGRRPPHFESHWIPPYLHLPLILVCVLLLLLALFLVPLVRYIMRPLRTFSEAFQQVSDGDFSTLPAMDQEFQPLVEAFNHMTQEIQAMLKEKQRLIADVSHELRSPLARMRVSMELLSKEGKGKAKYIERAIHEIEELDHLINDLLDVSALDLNEERSPLEKIHLQSWISAALDRHQLWFEQHHIHIETRFPEDAEDILVLGRQHLLDRALNNLLSNVIKYAPKNSQVDLSLEANAEHTLVHIRDRGPGVPAAALSKLTEPFYRVDTSRTRKTGGNGLGLAIVHKVMILHQGSVRFALPTDQDGGLIVSLCFPAIAQFRGTGRLVTKNLDNLTS